MSDAAGLYALFFSSFLAATLLPGGSEASLFAVLKIILKRCGSRWPSASSRATG
jgi:membrane protein YqaA with SNARE-associated domain